MVFSPCGGYLAAGNGKIAEMWAVDSRKFEGNCFSGHLGHDGLVYSVAFSPDGRYIATGSGDKWTVLWVAATSSHELPMLGGHTGHVCSVAFSHDGGLLATGSNDQTVNVWNVENIDATFQCYADPTWCLARTLTVNSVTFSSTTVLATTLRNTVSLWDARSGDNLGSFGDNLSSVTFFPPDG